VSKDDNNEGKNLGASRTTKSARNMSRRSFLSTSSGLLASPALVAAGGLTISSFPMPAVAQTAKAKIVAKYGHDSATSSGVHAMGEYFAGRVAQLTEGEVEVQIYPSSQLGSSAEMAQAVKQGTLEFAFPTATLAGNVIAPELGVFGLPYIMKSWYQSARIDDSQAAEFLRAKAIKNGVRLLAFAPNALRILLYKMKAGGKPIARVEDVEGMKIRVIESPIDVGMWKACGALPTPIPFGEVYSAMQQGVVDGVDNAFNTAAGIRLDEVTNAVTLTGHRYEIDIFVTNEAWFQNLSKRTQQAMLQAAREASIYQQGVVMIDDIRVPKVWADKRKIQVVVPDQSGFIKKMTSIYPQFEAKFGKEIMQLVEKV